MNAPETIDDPTLPPIARTPMRGFDCWHVVGPDPTPPSPSRYVRVGPVAHDRREQWKHLARLLGALLGLGLLLAMALQLAGCGDDAPPSMTDTGSTGGGESSSSDGGLDDTGSSTGESSPECAYFYKTCFCDGEVTEPQFLAGICLCGDQAIEAEACEPPICEQLDFGGGPGLLCSCNQGATGFDPQWSDVEGVCWCGQTPVSLTPNCMCGNGTLVTDHPELCCEFVGGVCLCGGEISDPSIIEGVCACGLTPLEMELCEA